MDAELLYSSTEAPGRTFFGFYCPSHDFGSRRLAILLFRPCIASDHRLASVYGRGGRHSGVVVEMRRFAANCARFLSWWNVSNGICLLDRIHLCSI